MRRFAQWVTLTLAALALGSGLAGGQTLPVVTAGQFCPNEPGAIAQTVTGLRVICSTTPTDNIYRFRDASRTDLTGIPSTSTSTGGSTVSTVVTGTGIVSITPAPADAGTVSTQQVVTPGAFCSPQGATGITVTGLAQICTTTATDSQLRWRAATTAAVATPVAGSLALTG